MSITSIVLLCIAAVAVFWAVGAYNRLIRLKNTISNAFGQIDVQLKRRYDLIPNLVETAKKYLSHEHDTLQSVIAARGQASAAAAAVRAQPANASAVGALGMAEQVLGNSLGQLFGRLNAVAESYPELKADQVIRDLSEELTSTENKVGFARQAYNDAVLDFNNGAEQFPAVIVARIFGFVPAAMLQATGSAQERETLRVQF
jgi:LemA protein